LFRKLFDNFTLIVALCDRMETVKSILIYPTLYLIQYPSGSNYDDEELKGGCETAKLNRSDGTNR